MIRPVRGRAAFAAFRRASIGRCGQVRARYLRPSEANNRTHAAYAVSRKVGNAVTRNRIRRRLRAALVELDRRGALPTGSYLLSSGPELASCPFTEVVSGLECAVGKATSRSGAGR